MDVIVSIIIPHHNNSKILIECIDSLMKSSFKNIEIIVVDNASSDSSCDDVSNRFPNVIIKKSNINLGYAGGCNLGSKIANGEYLFFLNNDTIVGDTCIEKLVYILNENDNISSVQPKIININNSSYFDYAGASGGFIDYLVFPFARGRIFNTIEKDDGQYDNPRKIFWASGAGFLTRKNIFKKALDFDNVLFAHMEEIDYHWKCLLNGYEIYVTPQSLIYHKGGQTLAYGSYKKIYLNHRNSMILFLTNNKKNSFSKIIKRITLEKIAFIYYIMKLNFKGALAIFNANMWLLLNMKYLIERKQKIKKLIKTYHPISNQLIREYSIIKKYFYNKKTKFNQLD